MNPISRKALCLALAAVSFAPLARNARADEGDTCKVLDQELRSVWRSDSEHLRKNWDRADRVALEIATATSEFSRRLDATSRARIREYLLGQGSDESARAAIQADIDSLNQGPAPVNDADCNGPKASKIEISQTSDYPWCVDGEHATGGYFEWAPYPRWNAGATIVSTHAPRWAHEMRLAEDYKANGKARFQLRMCMADNDGTEPVKYCLTLDAQQIADLKEISSEEVLAKMGQPSHFPYSEDEYVQSHLKCDLKAAKTPSEAIARRKSVTHPGRSLTGSFSQPSTSAVGGDSANQ